MRTASLLACLCISISGLGQVQNGAFNVVLKSLLSHSVAEVSVQQLKTSDQPILLDAREREEYNVSHLPAARFVGYKSFDGSAVEDLPKNKKIIVYCSVGYRSEKIAEKLKLAGFTDVSNLYGGIFEWVNQENPVVNLAGVATDSVHAYNKSWGIWLNRGIKVY